MLPPPIPAPQQQYTMHDIQELRTRLAREEAALAKTLQKVAAAERTIEELRGRSDALKKRVTLLREYIEMVEGGVEGDAGSADLPELLPQGLALPEADPLELALPEAQPVRATDTPPGLADWLSLSRQASEPLVAEALSFEAGIDEQQLADEILPRAGSFEDGLLLLLAHCRRPLTPKAIIKEFRRLEYASAARAMPKWVEAQLELRPAFFTRAGRSGFVLSKEGRQEAQRILNQLRF